MYSFQATGKKCTVTGYGYMGESKLTTFPRRRIFSQIDMSKLFLHFGEYTESLVVDMVASVDIVTRLFPLHRHQISVRSPNC